MCTHLCTIGSIGSREPARLLVAPKKQNQNTMPAASPVDPFAGMRLPIVTDGGLATCLEDDYNQDLNDPMWSTAILEKQPELITA